MKLIRGNIERVAESSDMIEKLKAAGYEEMGSSRMSEDVAEITADVFEMDTTHLRKLAKEKGISGYSALTKAELQEALKDVI